MRIPVKTANCSGLNTAANSGGKIASDSGRNPPLPVRASINPGVLELKSHEVPLTTKCGSYGEWKDRLELLGQRGKGG